jgi:leader peptidase (prepilin peptidase) / N-methyltransferase
VIETALAFVFGLLIGSFLNVCVYRWTHELSVVRPRSACPACGTMIAWYDNIPVLSFALLRGRCRHCRGGISWRYPVIELLTALSFAAAVYRLGLSPAAVRLAVLSAICIGLIATDLAERLLPDKFTVGGAAIGIVLAWIGPLTPLFPYSGLDSFRWLGVMEALIGAALPSLAMWGLGELFYRLRKREGLGLGDVKMIAMTGAFLGLKGALLTLIIGSTAGAIIGVVYIWIARKSAATYQIPFGVFLGIAAITVAWFGEPLTHWYLGIGT